MPGRFAGEYNQLPMSRVELDQLITNHWKQVAAGLGLALIATGAKLYARDTESQNHIQPARVDLLVHDLDSIFRLDINAGTYSSVYEANPGCVITDLQAANGGTYLSLYCDGQEQGIFKLDGHNLDPAIPGPARDFSILLSETVYVSDGKLWKQVADSEPVLLASGLDHIASPTISPTGEIAFLADIENNQQVFLIKPGNPIRQLTTDANLKHDLQFSPNGNHLAYLSDQEETGLRILYLENPNNVLIVDLPGNIATFNWENNHALFVDLREENIWGARMGKLGEVFLADPDRYITLGKLPVEDNGLSIVK